MYATVPCRWFESQFVILPVNGDPYVYGMTSFSPYVMRQEMPWLKDKIFASPGSTKMNNTLEGIEGVIDTINAIVREHGLENLPVGLDGCTSEFLVGEGLSKKGLKAVDGKRCMFDARMVKNKDEVEPFLMLFSIPPRLSKTCCTITSTLGSFAIATIAFLLISAS
ncbi:hypothetical protein AGMMS49983_20940 [Clostridia bacterium]|nr:hypothetical protein AGMMS49983_20940 [Clostridia bacterium]